MEKSIKMDDLGVPHDLGNLHIDFEPDPGSNVQKRDFQRGAAKGEKLHCLPKIPCERRCDLAQKAGSSHWILARSQQVECQ